MEEVFTETSGKTSKKITTNTFDSFGRLIETVYKEGDKETTTKKSYYPNGTVESETAEDGTITSYTYDKENTDGATSTTVTDANGNESKTITNSQNIPVLIKDLGDGSIKPITTATEYNSKDNVVKETNTEGNYKTYEYDDKERLSALNYYDSKKNRTLRTEYEYESYESDNL